VTPDEQEALAKQHRSPFHQPIRRWDRSMSQPTVAQLVVWCDEAGLAFDEVRVTGGEISWEGTETDEERDKRIAHWHAADQAREAWAQRRFDATTTTTEEAWPTRTQETA
jgi:hypothetical protein